jgi:hypothetical protein
MMIRASDPPMKLRRLGKLDLETGDAFTVGSWALNHQNGEKITNNDSSITILCQ